MIINRIRFYIWDPFLPYFLLFFFCCSLFLFSLFRVADDWWNCLSFSVCCRRDSHGKGLSPSASWAFDREARHVCIGAVPSISVVTKARTLSLPAGRFDDDKWQGPFLTFPSSFNRFSRDQYTYYYSTTYYYFYFYYYHSSGRRRRRRRLVVAECGFCAVTLNEQSFRAADGWKRLLCNSIVSASHVAIDRHQEENEMQYR